MDPNPDPWVVLADPRARAEELERARVELTMDLLDSKGPSAAALAAVPRLVTLLASPSRAPSEGAALISLSAQMALGERPWPAPAESVRHQAVREALLGEVPRLLPLFEREDARTRHLLAHLLAWLGPSAAIDAALRERLKVEKYEAGRASLVLALAVHGHGPSRAADAALLRSQLAPNAPRRVATAAAVGLCLLDASQRSDPLVRSVLESARLAAELGAAELAWNRGDLRAMAIDALEREER